MGLMTWKCAVAETKEVNDGSAQHSVFFTTPSSTVSSRQAKVKAERERGRRIGTTSMQPGSTCVYVLLIYDFMYHGNAGFCINTAIYSRLILQTYTESVRANDKIPVEYRLQTVSWCSSWYSCGSLRSHARTHATPFSLAYQSYYCNVSCRS